MLTTSSREQPRLEHRLLPSTPATLTPGPLAQLSALSVQRPLARSLFQLPLSCLLSGECSFSSEWMIVSCVTFLIGVHFMPDPTQGIFWFESSSYYLGFYGLGLLSLGLCLLAAVSTAPGRSYVYMIISCLTAFLTAGGNMQSGMLFAFAFLAAVIVSFYVRNPNRFRTIPPLAVFLAGFLISVMAPGNAVRGKGSYSGIGPVMTVYKSLHQACVLLDGWRNLFMISLLIGLVLPVCMRAVKRIDFRFPYPLLITIYLFGMFSCQFAPSFYAYDMIGPLRSVNPIYISFVLLTVFLIYYWCGWLYEKIKDFGMYQSFDYERFYAWYFPKGILLTALLFGIGCISSDRLSYITGVSALTSLVSGEAQTYDAERFERERIFLENEGSKTDMVIDDLSAKPYLLYFADGEPKADSTNWINRGISTYYGFESLTKKENGSD